jgi:hypothetical protein
MSGKYVVRGVGTSDLEQARDIAINRAYAQPGDGIPIFNRPYHALCVIRYYPEQDEVLEHRFDRLGRELQGTRLEAAQ